MVHLLKVIRTLELLASLEVSPSQGGIGRNVELVNVGRGDALQFENDLDLSISIFADCVSVLNHEGKRVRTVNLDKGDKAIIMREGSPFAYVVRGVEWGRRK